MTVEAGIYLKDLRRVAPGEERPGEVAPLMKDLALPLSPPGAQGPPPPVCHHQHHTSVNDIASDAINRMCTEFQRV